jgi:hypothetical protein
LVIAPKARLAGQGFDLKVGEMAAALVERGEQTLVKAHTASIQAHFEVAMNRP